MNILLAGILLGLLFGLLVGLLWKGILREPLATAAPIAGITTVFLTIILFYGYFVGLNKDLSIRIVAPSMNDVVQKQVDVSGIVSHFDSRVYILVHPVETDELWVQRLPVVDKYGRWNSNALIGTDELGAGQEYEIVAIAERRVWWLETIFDVKEFTPGDTFKELPTGFALSNLVRVTREEKQ